ncbi:hypothetical protein [Pandoraea anhela]|uniref:Uncharacterized protein n=1 Tax=Pandoraea anhela TaxID=2508295 RepID=A0A5E4SEX0_9BURK|nr:hypothetical protein [Pandoraea anhela]VVD73653.1 hypothetical protein PAN31108_00732 [Pandoraea anhela]
MPYASHCRAIPATPRYGMTPCAQTTSALLRASPGLAHSFRRARTARTTSTACTAHTPQIATERQPPSATRHRQDTGPSRRAQAVWPAAFAVLLVANMMPPAGSGLPRGVLRQSPDVIDTAPGFDASQTHANAPSVNVSWKSGAGDVVAIHPVENRVIKTDYTLSEFLSAVAASSAPFQNAGDALLQMYSLVTGETVDTDTYKTLEQWTEALDFATGLIPDVGLTRMPGEAAGIAADRIEGRETSVERLAAMVQSADARNWKSRGIVQARPDFREMYKQRYPERFAARKKAAREPADPQREPLATKPEGAIATVDNPGGVAHSSRATNVAPPALPTGWHIEGEHEHLNGYAQTLPQDRLPAGHTDRLVMVDGSHYLRGEAGYYRAMRGRSIDHWLVLAPRGSGHAAQVPVIYDPVTGNWHAEKPLRLCGGGCGSSREGTPDSIAMDRDKIIDALAHLRDDNVREGIRYAFNDLSLLHLIRSNRPDLHSLRDNSIIDHRAALRASMKRIRRNVPLIKQQEEASLITTMHYYWNHYGEAFCQENSEILFHYLLANRIPPDRIRMITVQPKNRPPHVLVLYTESERLIGLLEAATPQPPLNFEPDGINDMLFAREVYESRDSTVLLDPWSRARATAFVNANHAVDLVDTLDAAFADIGHRPGSMYRVSITRPLGTRRESATSLGSTGSSRSGSSVGLSSGTSSTSGTSGTSGSSGSTSLGSASAHMPGPASASKSGGVAGNSGTGVMV